MVLENLLFFDKKGEQYKFQFNGEYWEGSVLFPIVSEKLFEIEHIFVIEKFLEGSDIKYGYPHEKGISNSSSPVWRTRWESDYDEKIDVTGIIYTYELGIDSNIDGPLLVKAKNVEFYPEYDSGDTIDPSTGLVDTSSITSSSMQINIALNSDNEGIYDRKLIFEDYTNPSSPKTILTVSFHGEVEGEDSRLSVLLANFGRDINTSDAKLFRDYDIKDDYPDYELINKKRKELLLTGDSIFPYIGSYKSLINAIRFFGYYDLRIKEYWLNIKSDTSDTLTPLQQNREILKQISRPNLDGTSSLELISSLLKDENEGKFKHIEIYGKNKDGTFGLKRQYEEIFPSKSFKKTSLFGLFYDLNKVNEDAEEDEYGYPIVEDNFLFSPEEILLKLFGLRERLKRDYLPLNARIVDITGEGVYFNIYKTRGWVDSLNIDEIKSGIEVDFKAYPEEGYVDDLRPFLIKPDQDTILYPNINGVESGISYYGNDVDPYTSSQNYPISSMKLLDKAIISYYDDVRNGDLPKFLGDDEGYQRFLDKNNYSVPAGFPVVLENTTFDLPWDDTSGTWESIGNETISTDFNVSSVTGSVSANPGHGLDSTMSTDSINMEDYSPSNVLAITIGTGKDWFIPNGTNILLVRIQAVSDKNKVILGYIDSTSYNTTTGLISINLINVRGTGTYSNWEVSVTNVFDSGYQYVLYTNWLYSGGFYSWDRIKYLDFYEMEWTIYKKDENPYYFSIRGEIKDLERIAHFLPYTGEYTVQCRLWDTLNSISLGFKRNYLKVKKRSIKLNSVTRFRQSETYDWNNMPLMWETYESQWVFPIENNTNETEMPTILQNFPEYGNALDIGQDCEVLITSPEIKALTQFDFTALSKSIVNIVSSPIGSPSVGYGFAKVTTTTAHGINENDSVWIIKSDGTPYGNFTAFDVTSTTFRIAELILPANTITGGKVYGPGNIKIFDGTRKIIDSNFDGSLESFSGKVYNDINTNPVDPKYKVYSLLDSSTPGYKRLVIQAPNNTGEFWNGRTLTIQYTGCVYTPSSSVQFSGGVNERPEYVPYDFGVLPKDEMRHWGTRGLSWDTFEDVQFDKVYAHCWDMYDYHNDFLGGFKMYSLQYGDNIKVSKRTSGLTLGETDSPPNSYLDLSEAASQLNSSIDENITRFDYTVRSYSVLGDNYNPDSTPISPDLNTVPGPRNVKKKFFQIPIY